MLSLQDMAKVTANQSIASAVSETTISIASPAAQLYPFTITRVDRQIHFDQMHTIVTIPY